ncbi:MAG: FeoB-associated Cys-rich membrane protein [Planctomycetaceae bacterium]|nr:FeoB-associated Cys-rich membrane protein [Planctomycetaceae bacterium]
MTLGWQDIAVAAICLAAALYVARAVWKSLVGRSSAGCGTGCGKCSSSQSKPVMQIESPSALSADSPSTASLK